MDTNYINDQIKLIENKIKEAELLLSDPDMAPLAREELERLKREKDILLQALNANDELQTTNDPSTGIRASNQQSNPDSRNVILEIKGATGGDEAKIWARDLLRMYMRYAESKGFKVEVLDDWTIKIAGPQAFGLFKYEAGVHRVQRTPETEKRGRTHTSTATVSVLPELEDIDLHIKEDDIEFEAFRASSHGGQNVQKVSSAVRLRHAPSGIVVTCQTQRHQAQNRELALRMLRAKLWEQEMSKRHETLSELKSTQVGKGTRAEKIRTYNFPQNRVTDHRINQSWHDLENIMEGNLDKVLFSLKDSI